jgi:hypothetical protein
LRQASRYPELLRILLLAGGVVDVPGGGCLEEAGSGNPPHSYLVTQGSTVTASSMGEEVDRVDTKSMDVIFTSGSGLFQVNLIKWV